MNSSPEKPNERFPLQLWVFGFGFHHVVRMIVVHRMGDLGEHLLKEPKASGLNRMLKFIKTDIFLVLISGAN